MILFRVVFTAEGGAGSAACALPGRRGAVVLLRRLIMIPGLYKINAFMPDNIYKPMFLGDSSRPDAGPKKFEGLGLADALKWVSHDCFDQLKNSEGGLAIRLNPVAKILPKLRLEHGFPLLIGLRLFRRIVQNRPRIEGHQLSAECLILSEPCQVPKAVSLHWRETGAGARFRARLPIRRLLSWRHPRHHAAE